jgi:hypothetical protein
LLQLSFGVEKLVIVLKAHSTIYRTPLARPFVRVMVLTNTVRSL